MSGIIKATNLEVTTIKDKTNTNKNIDSNNIKVITDNTVEKTVLTTFNTVRSPRMLNFKPTKRKYAIQFK